MPGTRPGGRPDNKRSGEKYILLLLLLLVSKNNISYNMREGEKHFWLVYDEKKKVAGTGSGRPDIMGSEKKMHCYYWGAKKYLVEREKSMFWLR